MIGLFIHEEWRKLLATVLVASFFFYFWLQGPFDFISENLQILESIETAYSTPKVVAEGEKETSAYGTIGESEIGGYGHSLILERETEANETGLIVTAQTAADFESQLDQMYEHASQLIKGKITPINTGNIPYLEVRFENQDLVYIESQGMVEGIRGYAGPINVGVFVNSAGAIHSIHHVASQETESYLEKIYRNGYYDQYGQMDFLQSQQVDAVSGATLTSEAIARTTSLLLTQTFPDPMENFSGNVLLGSVRIEAILSNLWILHILVIFGMFFYGFQKKWKKSKKGVLIVSLLSVAYIGFFLNNSFTYVSFIHPFVGTSVSSFVGLYALFTLLGAIWGKNTYCKYVCPFGNVQRLMLTISPKVSRPFFLSNKWMGRVRDSLTLVLIAGVLLGMRDWSNYELFPDLFGVSVLSFWFIIAVAVLLLNLRYPLIWCRLLCPTGSVLDFVTDITKKK
jgi:NosR/NirI family nitrous oxide reductase transcriptional regulator